MRVATLPGKLHREYRLSAISNSESQSKNLNISSSSKPDLKSHKIPSKRLRRSPSVEKVRCKKSRWTVPFSTVWSYCHQKMVCPKCREVNWMLTKFKSNPTFFREITKNILPDGCGPHLTPFPALLWGLGVFFRYF